MTDKKVTSLGARRAQSDGGAWTPIECLRHAIEEIESGVCDPERMVICYQGHRDKDGNRAFGFYNATPEPTVALGLLTVVSHVMATEGEL